MTALHLQWKEEPLSPLYTDEAAWLHDDTFYQTAWNDDDDDRIKFEDDLLPCESKAEVASIILENLENLVDLDELIKEEPYLLDEKMLPILDDVDPPRAIEVISSVKMESLGKTPPPDTHFLLKEFENVYDVVGFSHDTLTPPQSPPSEKPILTTLEPLMATASQPHYASLPDRHPYNQYVPEKELLPNVLAYRPPSVAASVVVAAVSPPTSPVDYPAIHTPQPDIAHELAVVDELVRSRVEHMQWGCTAPPSPNSNSSSSGSSNFGDCSSDADPEWVPETVEQLEGGEDEAGAAPGKIRRKKSYARSSPVDRKSRKKEQNKNAATRYRMKKKAEVEVILSEEKELSDYNHDLENKIVDMQREIKYLKGLMYDLFKAKGLIN